MGDNLSSRTTDMQARWKCRIVGISRDDEEESSYRSCCCAAGTCPD